VVLEYEEMLQVYADVAGLRRRLIVVLPWLTPAIASWWVGLVTPMPSGFGKAAGRIAGVRCGFATSTTSTRSSHRHPQDLPATATPSPRRCGTGHCAVIRSGLGQNRCGSGERSLNHGPPALVPTSRGLVTRLIFAPRTVTKERSTSGDSTRSKRPDGRGARTAMA